MRACAVLLAMACAFLAVCPLSFAVQPIEVKRVSFAAGASSATLRDSITGDKTVDYKLGAKAGQTMSVKLETSNASNYFNVLPPGSETALFVGSTSGNEWTGTLPVDGDYTVRVYLMRNAGRRNEKAHYALTIGITGRADAKVSGTSYHATGNIPCSVGTDPKGSAQCSFGVIRSAPGHAEVYLASPGFDVMMHENRLRVLKFASGTVASDPGDKVTSQKQDDNWMIGVNDFYFYIIPEAVISGG